MDLAVHVHSDAVVEESFRELHRRGAEEWKNRFYIVFEGKLRFWGVFVNSIFLSGEDELPFVFHCLKGLILTQSVSHWGVQGLSGYVPSAWKQFSLVVATRIDGRLAQSQDLLLSGDIETNPGPPR